MKQPIKNGIIHAVVFASTLGLIGATYAALSSLTATTGETLTVSKWDALVEHAVPSTAVMAFASSTCPTGWSEYTPAQGRFIRGIDKTGTNIDPDGERAFGSTQNHDFLSHYHGLYADGNSGTSWGFTQGGQGSYGAPHTRRTTSVGGSETRPVNVALLYCIKD